MSAAELKEEAIRQFVAKVEAPTDESVLISILDFLKGMDGNEIGGLTIWSLSSIKSSGVYSSAPM